MATSPASARPTIGPTQLFIDGEFVDALDGAVLEVYDPHDASVLASVAAGGAADVDRAVDAAERAFPAWAATPPAARGRLLMLLADAVEEHADELARLEACDTGHPLRDASLLDVPRTAATLRYFGGIADKVEGSVIPVDAATLNYVMRQPLGVVGSIVPWNFPLMFCAWKLGPALAAGNTAVLKPAELTPLSSLRLAELIADVGFPPGTVNIVPGEGATAGARIAEHPRIAKVSFTGSTRVGQSIVRASAGNLKRLQLELGGKGANIVFADADLDDALLGSVYAIFQNQGQACIAGSRLIVQEEIADDFLARVEDAARRIRIGAPLDELTQLGPLTSAGHRERVLEYVDIATEEGGEVLAGGSPPATPGLEAGFYVEPTVVLADPTSRVAQEEVFGPFLAVSTFKTDEQALAIANGTQYGLGAGLWTRDLARAHRFGAELQAGMVWVNTYKRASPGTPFGGVGMSGYGRENGFEVMHDYTDAHSVWINVAAPAQDWYGLNDG